MTPVNCILYLILQHKKYCFVHGLFSTIGILVGISIYKKGMAQRRIRFVTRFGLFPNDTGLSTVLENHNRQSDDAR